MTKTLKCYLVHLVVLAFVIKLEAVTVNPLCPTNKIAPHKRNVRGERRTARTIGAFYDLLVPSQPTNNPSPLQEEPQNESTDCGDIEDYDENYLSSANPSLTKRHFFHHQSGSHDQQFSTFYQQLFSNTNTKPTPIKPVYMATRPPTGGYFGTNSYRPQPDQKPSNHLKPVHEYGEDHNLNYHYQPGLVGALSNNVIGAVQVRPSESTIVDTTAQKQHLYPNHAFPPLSHSNAQNQERPRYYGRDHGILKSFIDLIL